MKQHGLHILIAGALLMMTSGVPASITCGSSFGVPGENCCCTPVEPTETSASSCCSSQPVTPNPEPADHDCSCTISQNNWLVNQQVIFVPSLVPEKFTHPVLIESRSYPSAAPALIFAGQHFPAATSPPGRTVPSYILLGICLR